MTTTKTTAAVVTAEQIKTGLLVQFRPDFSAALVGMVFEMESRADGSGDMVLIDASNGRTVVFLRTRIGKRWNHRSAYLDDLTLAAI